MGFDIYAVKPKTDKEEHSYFRANVWYWRPLWAFVEKICCDEISKLEEGVGHSNDGYEISDEIASIIGRKINVALENGLFKQLQDDLDTLKNGIPEDDCRLWYNCDYELTKSFADFCLNSGGFSIC